MIDLIASILVRALNSFFNVMPMSFNLWLGRCIGVVVYMLSGKRKRITYANLKAAFCEEKSPGEIRYITKDVYRNLVQTFVELLCLTKMDKKYTEKYVKIHNLENIKTASKNPNGMILISAHFGNWELSTATSANRGYPMHVLARDQKMVRLNELLNQLREISGNIVVRKGMDIKKIFKILHKGGSVGMLADQSAGTGGMLVDFFGRPASTSVGPYKFAQKSGASILPAFIYRRKGLYHDLILEPIMSVKKDEDITPYLRRYNSYLEKHIRNDPAQWFWMHKRWKLTTLKKILVLSDGKKGHLNQSLAVVKQIRQYRQEEGYSPDQLKVNVTEIHFKNRFYRTFFNLATPFMNRFLQGRPGFLKMVLQSGSHENIIRQYADVIVSCGSALVGVNKALKIENNARNVTVLDPGLRNRSSFDLIVMPRHDITGVKGQGSRVRDNVVMTELAPNLIDKKELDTMRQGARRRGHDVRGVPKHPCFGGKGQECPCIGLLFGGDNPYFHFSEKITRSVADNIKKVCKDLGGISYVTTSRRTSDMSEKILKDMFSDDVTCREFVSGKEDKDPNTVRKILTGSDVIIVSGESISMVSEAVASGRSVLVFMPEKKKKSITKYERFAGNLEKREYLRLADPADIGNAVKEVLKDGRNPEIPDDNIKIRSKLYKLF